MSRSKPIPLLTDVIGEGSESTAVSTLDSAQIEALAQAIEAKLQPLVKDAIRTAVKDSARRMARDLRNRVDSEMDVLIREAVSQVAKSNRRTGG